MLNTFNEIIWNYVPFLLIILIILIFILILLQVKNRFKNNKQVEVEEKARVEKKATVFKEEDIILMPKEKTKEEIVPKFVNANTIRIHTYILNEIRNLTTDNQILGFDYKSDYIQALIADIPKVIDYFLKNFGEFKEGIIPVLPCIPENLIPPNQLIANTFTGGKCNIPMDRIKNSSEIPKKPYWVFLVKVEKITLGGLFLVDNKEGLTVNELVRVAATKDSLWRNKNNHLVSINSLLDEISPVVFRYDLKNERPELCVLTKKDEVRDYYLITCKDRVCFAE